MAGVVPDEALGLPRSARKRLGLIVGEPAVLAAARSKSSRPSLRRRPASLHEAAERLGKAGVNIEAAFATGMAGNSVTIAFATSNPARAREALGQGVLVGHHSK